MKACNWESKTIYYLKNNYIYLNKRLWIYELFVIQLMDEAAS